MSADEHSGAHSHHRPLIPPTLSPGRSRENTLHRYRPSEPLEPPENAIKPGPTKPPHAAAPFHHHHHHRLHVRIPITNVPQEDHHHHNHDDNDDDEDTETPDPTQAMFGPHQVQNRPAINRGIAVNIAFRIAALDIDCEGYMYMLARTGNHDCGHPILPVKARGSEWRAFRDDMLMRFGWGSVLSASWLQSYNWACRILNIEVDRILVGIDTQTSLVNAAKAKFGLDSNQDDARASHTCPVSNPSARPSTSAQPSISAQPSTSTRSNVDHSAGPSFPASAEPNSKTSTVTGEYKTKTESVGTAENPSGDETSKPGHKDGMGEVGLSNPIEEAYAAFRAHIREGLAAIDPITKTVTPSTATGPSAPPSGLSTSVPTGPKTPFPSASTDASAGSNADPSTAKRKPRHRKPKSHVPENPNPAVGPAPTVSKAAMKAKHAANHQDHLGDGL